MEISLLSNQNIFNVNVINWNVIINWNAIIWNVIYWNVIINWVFFVCFSDQRLPDSSKRSERERKQIIIENSRSLKWAGMMKPEEEKKYFGPKAKNREKMINRVHKGVPDAVRGRLWYILLEVDRLKREQKGVYENMRELARRFSPDIRQIDLVNIFPIIS